jgi:hypothetical protein
VTNKETPIIVYKIVLFKDSDVFNNSEYVLFVERIVGDTLVGVGSFVNEKVGNFKKIKELFELLYFIIVGCKEGYNVG